MAESGGPITVVIADDQRMLRHGLRVILESEPDITVVAEAGDGREAIDLIARHQPLVALLDIRMPVMDGLTAARQVIAANPATRVLILTTFDADDYVYEALRAGVSGFLLKDAPADQLVSAVRCLAAGDALIDPVITKRLISRFTLAAREPTRLPDELGQLTARELEVLRLVARGLSNLEIAHELVVEENTVKTHVSRILMKLGLRDRVQAVVLAYESGFVTPDPRLEPRACRCAGLLLPHRCPMDAVLTATMGHRCGRRAAANSNRGPSLLRRPGQLRQMPGIGPTGPRPGEVDQRCPGSPEARRAGGRRRRPGWWRRGRPGGKDRRRGRPRRLSRSGGWPRPGTGSRPPAARGYPAGR